MMLLIFIFAAAAAFLRCLADYASMRHYAAFSCFAADALPPRFAFRRRHAFHDCLLSFLFVD